MNKKEYLGLLEAELKDFPESDRKEIVSDYEEHFTIGIEKGRTEDEIADKLGDPKKIVKEWNLERLVKKAETSAQLDDTVKAIIAIMGLSLFNFLIVMGPFAGIVGAIFGLIVGGLSLLVAGAATLGIVILSLFIPGIELGVSPLGGALLSIGIMCIGAVWTIINIYIVRIVVWLTIKYLKFNINLIKK
jgi:uncharacterized membrane protein